MKKLLVLGLAVAMVLAFTLPASAFESVFGGYWRTRFFTNQRFSGLDGDATQDISRVDSRTRLYYTAVLNDNLKLVNKFELNSEWGTGGASYGDYGADAVAVEVKETFVDANIGPVRAKVGTHDVTWARGFIYDDEFSGITLHYKAGDVLIPLTWMKGQEGGAGHNSQDVDILGLYPIIQVSEKLSLNPFIIYAYSKQDGGPTGGASTGLSSYGQNAFPVNYTPDGASVFWIGSNIDATLGPVSLWFTGAYVGGQVDNGAAGGDDLDVKGHLLAGGASVPVGPAELHGQAFYASGDDDPDDNDLEAFFGIGGLGFGWGYYWSEIMGLGVFDAQASAGSPNSDISNMWAANIGASIKPVEKLKLTGDVWYASLVEDNQTGDKKLGLEVDLKAEYQLMEGLNLTVVGAYLFADEATSATTQSNDEDPYEIGAELSLSF